MTTTAAATQKIKLQRGMPGWYVFYTRGFDFSIQKQGPGMWSVTGGTYQPETKSFSKETWIVADLNAARALIANTIAK